MTGVQQLCNALVSAIIGCHERALGRGAWAFYNARRPALT